MRVEIVVAHVLSAEGSAGPLSAVSSLNRKPSDLLWKPDG